MDKEAGQLDVGVPEIVDNGDAVVSQDLPRVGGRLLGDQKDRGSWPGGGLVDDLPGSRCAGAILDLDGHGRLGSSEFQHGICAVISPGNFGRHSQAWDRAQDAERTGLTRARGFHGITVFHHDGKYIRFGETS
ncbi:MAG: hypothetical protein ACRDRJ_42875 [Streptosporangiaceae bacterium]